MLLVEDTLPDDVVALKALVAELHDTLEREVSAREQALADKGRENALLRERLRLLLAQRFGAASERVSDAQLGLFNEAEQESEDSGTDSDETRAVAGHRRRRARRKPLDPHWPRVELVHDLPDEEKVCPSDGTALELIGVLESEQLDIVPATVRVLRHQRRKYACPCCRLYLKTAPMPAQPIAKSQASPGLLAHIATGKYVDALPLYRQAQQLERLGLRCSRTTLARWMVRCGELVQPLWNLLEEQLLALDYLQCDESRMQVLKEAGKTPESESYVWVRRSGLPERPIVLFDYSPSRSGEVAKQLLTGFEGTLQADAYSGYGPAARELGLVRAYCMAHARRGFTDALKANGVNPKKLPLESTKAVALCREALGYIRKLYAIERRVAEEPPDERWRRRQIEAVPILEAFKRWLDANAPRVRPSSELAKAIQYSRNHWSGLIRYCDDGRVAIDNNRCENAIRPFWTSGSLCTSFSSIGKQRRLRRYVFTTWAAPALQRCLHAFCV